MPVRARGGPRVGAHRQHGLDQPGRDPARQRADHRLLPPRAALPLPRCRRRHRGRRHPAAHLRHACRLPAARRRQLARQHRAGTALAVGARALGPGASRPAAAAAAAAEAGAPAGSRPTDDGWRRRQRCRLPSVEDGARRARARRAAERPPRARPRLPHAAEPGRRAAADGGAGDDRAAEGGRPRAGHPAAGDEGAGDGVGEACGFGRRACVVLLGPWENVGDGCMGDERGGQGGWVVGFEGGWTRESGALRTFVMLVGAISSRVGAVKSFRFSDLWCLRFVTASPTT